MSHHNLLHNRHVFIVLDQTLQKQAEMELERHKNDLEKIVQMRTMEVQEKELR